MSMGRLTFDEARAVKRDPIEIGKSYQFFSTVRDIETPGTTTLIRDYTGQHVKILAVTCGPGMDDWIEGETEAIYHVQAEDGVEFDAYEGELNGWFLDTGQFYGPFA
jgi:hypothetical protein